MSNKFKVGDRVIINRHSKELPKYIRAKIKRFYTIRIIGAIWYNPKTQHTRYYIGKNNKGDDISRYPFRAEMLKIYKMKPHTKRLKLRHATINKVELAIVEYS